MSDSECGSGGGSPGSESGGELEDAEAPARALRTLDALRRSRAHYDVLLEAGGAEVAAHRAVLAAASPYLLRRLGGAPRYRVPGVAPRALAALVDYVYSGRLRAPDGAAARELYEAAWRLRVEPARALLAERLVRRPRPHAALAARALPGLEPHHAKALDDYIADNFEEVCESGALNTLPQIEILLMRESSAADGAEGAAAVADAALAWLRAQAGAADPAELAARPHLLYVDERGELRDCGDLPAARGDAPELQRYRREAERRRAEPAPPAAAPEPDSEPELELGARARPADCAVLAARRTPGGATRALLALRGRLAAARVAWSDVAAGGGGLARGGALPGDAADGARRARMAEGRCAHGAAALGGRLIVCGGYDRARALRSAEAYEPAANAWTPLPDMRAPRARFSAAALGGAVLAAGGSDGLAELDSVDAYTESGGWAARARLPLALAHAGAAADEAAGALYLVGGWAGGAPQRRVLRYSAAADAWEEAAAMGAARAQCGAALWRGAVWALGGRDAWRCLASTERLAGAGWQPGPALPTARRSVGAAEWRGRLVAAGGSDGAASLRRTEWLQEESAGWRAGPALRRARASPGLVALGAALYAAGGFDGREFLSCVECLYEPDGEWTALCDPLRPALAPLTPTDVREQQKREPSPREESTPQEKAAEESPRAEGSPREAPAGRAEEP